MQQVRENERKVLCVIVGSVQLTQEGTVEVSTTITESEKIDASKVTIRECNGMCSCLIIVHNTIVFIILNTDIFISNRLGPSGLIEYEWEYAL